MYARQNLRSNCSVQSEKNERNDRRLVRLLPSGVCDAYSQVGLKNILYQFAGGFFSQRICHASSQVLRKYVTPIRRSFVNNPSCHLLKSMGFCLTLRVKSSISPQEESAHGRQNCPDVLFVCRSLKSYTSSRRLPMSDERCGDHDHRLDRRFMLSRES